MEKEDNFSAASAMAPSFSELDYSTTIPPADVTTTGVSAGGGMVNYMINEAPPHDHFGSGPSHMMDRSFSTFADVLQFADFGPKLALHHEPGDSTNNHMLRFPVLDNHHHHQESHDDDDNGGDANDLDHHNQIMIMGTTSASGADNYFPDQVNINNTGTATGTCLDPIMNNKNKNNSNGKRKRARIVKTNEEVESQRRTHIAVERNRRKQMNEHLRVLRSLMPSSYVQRGDQASIVGGAIEFVRELEQLLQCLESQKRRRLYGETSALPLPINTQPNNDQIIQGTEDNLDGLMIVGIQEETAESKSSIADVEVKLLGFDAFIKILSRRRPGQLIKAISALQHLHFTILHTNVTTIEQTVLYSFNVKIGSETSFSADDIATSVHQIFTFIHTTNTPM